MNLTKNQIIFFGFVFHLLAAIFSVGYHQCDELFQVFEFAGYKLGLNKPEEMPWEFAEQMRSGIQPLIVYGFTKAFHFLSITNPFTIALFLRLIQSCISFLALVNLLKLLEEEITPPKAKIYLWFLSLLAWCLPYFHARLSSENFSATLFVFGLTLALKQLKTSQNLGSWACAGFLFGLSFLCRFQTGFMVAGFLTWIIFVNKTGFKEITIVLISFLVALAFGIVIDHWLYGEWTLSWWNYLDQNLFKAKASGFGEQPFYFYISEALLQLIPPFSLLIVIALVVFWLKYKKHYLTWITLPFILLHFFIGHKELRFLFPTLNFLPFICLYFYENINHEKSKILNLVRNKMVLNIGMGLNILLLLVFTFKPADDTSHSLKKIHDLVEGKSPVLFYEGNNPYNNNASLNYFRNRSISPVILSDQSHAELTSDEVYYFSEKFWEGDSIMKGGYKFVKIYSNFPDWFGHLNFNGWLNRAVTFSIYKRVEISYKIGEEKKAPK